MLLSAVSFTVFAETYSGTCGEGLTWTLDENGTLVISGKGEMENFWTAPWYDQRRSVNEVIINEGVTSIGEFAFQYCLPLKKISIPSTVTSINFGAFKGCELLETITLAKNSVFEMKNDCLINTKEKKLVVGTSKAVIPTDGSVTIIDDYAFNFRYFLKEVFIPKSVTHIGYSAFESCGSLKSVVFEESESSSEITINNYAFQSCSKLKSIKLPKNIKSFGEFVFDTSDFTIIGYANSTAEKYAKEYNIEFLNLDALPDSDSNLYMDNKSSTMPNVEENTPWESIISNLESHNVTADITDKNGNSLSSGDIVGTGCIVKTILGEYTIVVKGDVDGSGEVNATDYLHVKRALLKATTLTGAYFTAADTDESGDISSTDYVLIKGYFLGNVDLFA